MYKPNNLHSKLLASAAIFIFFCVLLFGCIPPPVDNPPPPPEIKRFDIFTKNLFATDPTCFLTLIYEVSDPSANVNTSLTVSKEDTSFSRTLFRTDEENRGISVSDFTDPNNRPGLYHFHLKCTGGLTEDRILDVFVHPDTGSFDSVIEYRVLYDSNSIEMEFPLAALSSTLMPNKDGWTNTCESKNHILTNVEYLGIENTRGNRVIEVLGEQKLNFFIRYSSAANYSRLGELGVGEDLVDQNIAPIPSSPNLGKATFDKTKIKISQNRVSPDPDYRSNDLVEIRLRVSHALIR